MGLRITTWNVNGIRNPFGYQPWRENRSFTAMFDILEADIVIMQELKIQRKDLTDDMVLIPGWDCYFSLPKHKKGYSGVGIFTRQSACAPIRAEEGLLGVLCPPDSSTAYRDLPPDASIGGYPAISQLLDLEVDLAELDAEGRCVILEFPAFVLFGVYSPANSNGLRDGFRLAFLTVLDARIRNLEKMGKQVILTGDLNVSRNELDSAGAEDDLRKLGMTHEEYVSTPNRRIFNQLLEGGEVIGQRDEDRERPILWDSCRGLHPGRKGMYTHWEQKINARPGNYGARIDYILCSITMKSWVAAANIQEGLMGSDHCPVYAVLNETVPWKDSETNIHDIVNPPGMFLDGIRQREPILKDLPPFSAKLMPEFDKRRSIKDMFKRHASTGTQDEARSLSTPTIDLPSERLTAPRWSSKEQITETTNGKRKRPNQPVAPSSKKSKPATTAASPSTLQKGQRTLKGFFQSKTQPSPKEMEAESPTKPPETVIKDKPHEQSQTPTATTLSSFRSRTTSISKTANEEIQSIDDLSIDDDPSQSDPRPTSSASSDFIDPFVAKEGWTKLFTKPQPPRCEDHDEPCITLETKKKGFNCGRSFWICPRPVGPSGSKEKNTEWRCRTFIWASDWNGSGQGK